MNKRPFGKTGLSVTPLGLGASHIGDSDVSGKDAGDFLNEALDLGINLIDTARGYGLSEERIGRHIRHRRSEYILSTKGGYGVEETPDWTPECITRGVERALRLLGTDVIDIFHLHSCDIGTLRGSGVVEELVRMREAGKIRLAAYSGENDERTWAIRSGLFDSIQSSLNICDQGVLENDMREIADMDLGYIAKRPLANAFWRFDVRPVGDYAEDYWLRAQTMDLAPPAEMEWDELALRFTLHQRGVCTAIAGTKNLARLRRNVELAQKEPLDEIVTKNLSRLYQRHGSNWRSLV